MSNRGQAGPLVPTADLSARSPKELQDHLLKRLAEEFRNHGMSEVAEGLHKRQEAVIEGELPIREMERPAQTGVSWLGAST